jgi:hypothetical protein
MMTHGFEMIRDQMIHKLNRRALIWRHIQTGVDRRNESLGLRLSRGSIVRLHLPRWYNSVLHPERISGSLLARIDSI